MKILSIIALLFGTIFVAQTSLAQTITGVVEKVGDGDTFTYATDGIRIRLCGVNAPEKNDPSGKEATAFLIDLIQKKHVACKVVGSGTPCDGRSKSRSYNRIVAQCFINEEDIAKKLVEYDHAKDVKKYSGGYYKQK